MEFHNFEAVQDADDEDAVHIGDMRALHEDLREALAPALREALPAALREILSGHLHDDRLRFLLTFLPAAQRERLSAFVLDGRLSDLLNGRWEVLNEPDGIREPGILQPDHPRIVIDNRHLEDEAAVHIGGMRPLHEDLREALAPALREALPAALREILFDQLHDALRFLLNFLPAAQRERLSAFVLDGRLADLLNDRWEVLHEPDGFREPGILRPDHPRIVIDNRPAEFEVVIPIDEHQPNLQRGALHVEAVGEPVLEPNDN